MVVHQFEEWSNFLEAWPACNHVCLSVPVNELGLGEFWEMAMVEVQFEYFKFFIVGLEIY